MPMKAAVKRLELTTTLYSSAPGAEDAVVVAAAQRDGRDPDQDDAAAG